MERITERCSDGSNVYLRILAGEDGLSDELYQFKMINTSRPTGLLPVHVTREKDGFVYSYDVTGLRSLKDSEGDDVQVDYLYSLISAMSKEAAVLSEFLLDPDKLLLTPETIFFRQWAGEVWFCYDPGKTEPLAESMTRLMEYFLKKLNPKDEEDILFMYGLYQRTREPNVSLTSLYDFFLENRENYLMIGEAREARKKDVRDPVPLAEAVAENSVYDELGIEKTPQTTRFSFLKKGKETPERATSEEEVLLDLDRFRSRKDVREQGDIRERKDVRERGDLPEKEAAGEMAGSREKAEAPVRKEAKKKKERWEELPEEPVVPIIHESAPREEEGYLEPPRMYREEEYDEEPYEERTVLMKLKPYAFELALGGVVLAGALLMVLT